MCPHTAHRQVQMMGVEHWLNFYSNHSDYTRVGVLQVWLYSVL